MSKRKRRLVRIVALVLVASMVILAVATLAISFVGAAEPSGVPVSTAWMEGLSDDLALSEITIPGTHDSASNYIFPSWFLRCQNKTIKNQLESGFRYLDIRLALTADEKGGARLKFVHSFGTCRAGKSLFSEPLFLEDVLSQVYDFLEEHPSETVIFCVKAENSEDDPKTVASLLLDTIEKDRKKWFTLNEIPSLGEVRGKAVLATRFGDEVNTGESRGGLNFAWEDQGNTEIVDLPYEVSMINEDEQLWVQDRYRYNVENKWEAFLDDLQNCQADESTFSLNFASTSGSGYASHPKGSAKTINGKLLKTELTPGVSYGILIVDFGTRKLAEHIYRTNL